MINIQNISDNRYINWCLVRYFYPTDHNSGIIRKVEKLYGDKLNFKDVKFPIKKPTKFKRRISSALVFVVLKIEKIPSLCVKKCCEDKHFDLLLIGEGEKRYYVLIKDFNKFMYAYTLHRGRKDFCRYCLQTFKAADVLKCQIKDCFKIKC